MSTVLNEYMMMIMMMMQYFGHLLEKSEENLKKDIGNGQISRSIQIRSLENKVLLQVQCLELYCIKPRSPSQVPIFSNMSAVV